MITVYLDIFIQEIHSETVRERLDELRDRRSLLKGLGAGAAVLTAGVTGQKINSVKTERNEKAREHLGNACDCLDQNYEIFADGDLSSLGGIYEFDVDTISQNLVEAERERDLALEQAGLLDLDSELRTALDDISVYINAQQLMQGMFGISGSIDDDELHDERIETTFQEVVQQHGLKSASESPAPQRSPTPFRSAHYQNRLSSISPPHGEITDLLSHSVSDLLDIARSGLEVLRRLDVLHKQLFAHLELPILDSAILEIDQHLSQERYHDQSEYDNSHHGSYEEALNSLAWYTDRYHSETPLPDELEGLTIGGRTVKTSDIAESATAYQEAASIFDQSVVAWRNGNHEKSNTRWSEGLATMFGAAQLSPF